MGSRGNEARRVPVTKMHGARNDFVILDQRTARIPDLRSFARWVCDRHAGIGADGLIAVEASGRADVAMRTINADGSEAEMCGNGIRCVARWLDEAGEGDRIRYDTDGGVMTTQILAREPEYSIRVGMGRPRVSALQDPNLPDAWYVDVGNPHVILFRPSVEDFDLAAVAGRLQHDARFARGTNVHVAAPDGNGSLVVRHWERGAGETMACGTGAVASAAVAIVRCIATSPVRVLVPGGRLKVEWDGAAEAYLIGPAVRVFDTQIEVRVGSFA
jgi:diaminopimelate epimerase